MPPKAAAGQTVEVDTDTSESTGSSDLDSIYGSDDGASLTTSIATYVKEYKMEHGRRYHAFEREKWIVPNDETQQNQMDLFHAVYGKAMALHVGETAADADKPYLAPITEKPQKILDLGTGTGIWAIQAADMHPSAEVIGTDLSPIQPPWVPPNLEFQVDDFDQDWTFKKEDFDFIHARGLHAACANWPKLVKQSYDALKPGGWIEIADECPEVYSDDGTLKDDSPTAEWFRNGVVGCDLMNRPALPYKNLQEWLTEAGFKSIEHKMIKLPVGVWPKNKALKELGGMMLVGMLNGAEGWTMDLYTKLLQKSEEEARKTIRDVSKEMKNRKVHMWMPFHIFYAQK